jgi:hypothetical protein
MKTVRPSSPGTMPPPNPCPATSPAASAGDVGGYTRVRMSSSGSASVARRERPDGARCRAISGVGERAFSDEHPATPQKLGERIRWTGIAGVTHGSVRGLDPIRHAFVRMGRWVGTHAEGRRPMLNTSPIPSSTTDSGNLGSSTWSPSAEPRRSRNSPKPGGPTNVSGSSLRPAKAYLRAKRSPERSPPRDRGGSGSPPRASAPARPRCVGRGHAASPTRNRAGPENPLLRPSAPPRIGTHREAGSRSRVSGRPSQSA